MNIDTTTEFGQRVLRRLKEDQIAWLTTISGRGIPQPRPIWFHWDGESILMYSEPNTYKLQHIARNPQVSFNFHSNAHGGDIVVFTGTATVDQNAPRADEIPEFIKKYRDRLPHIGLTPRTFAESYSVAIRLVPETLRGF
jgi:PPOX class probable F420-dependent enzyme